MARKKKSHKNIATDLRRGPENFNVSLSFIRFVGPDRTRLLHERLESMLSIFQLEIFEHAARRDSVVLQQFVFAVLHLQVLFTDGDHRSTVSADLLGDLVRFAFQIIRTDDTADQTVSACLLCRYRFACEEHQRRQFRIADRSTNGHGWRDAEKSRNDASVVRMLHVCELPMFHTWNGEGRCIAGDDDVTTGDQLTTGGSSQTEDFCDDRNGQLTYSEEREW